MKNSRRSSTVSRSASLPGEAVPVSGVFFGFELVEGAVYCDRHGCVHDDSLNPYGYAREDWCSAEDHRPLYAPLPDNPDYCPHGERLRLGEDCSHGCRVLPADPLPAPPARPPRRPRGLAYSLGPGRLPPLSQRVPRRSPR